MQKAWMHAVGVGLLGLGWAATGVANDVPTESTGTGPVASVDRSDDCFAFDLRHTWRDTPEGEENLVHIAGTVEGADLDHDGFLRMRRSAPGELNEVEVSRLSTRFRVRMATDEGVVVAGHAFDRHRPGAVKMPLRADRYAFPDFRLDMRDGSSGVRFTEDALLVEHDGWSIALPLELEVTVRRCQAAPI